MPKELPWFAVALALERFDGWYHKSAIVLTAFQASSAAEAKGLAVEHEMQEGGRKDEGWTISSILATRVPPGPSIPTDATPHAEQASAPPTP